ncbi:MAG TPA: ferritin-like domain-containing protein [Gaiellaceae bacterium]|nr:ferritin-like domain-containing protein [Gaiellaceae bacterium]
MKIDSLEDVLGHELNDLYSAEDQLVEALPKMAKAASNRELRQAFEQHLEETRDHRDRIQHIFGELGKRRTGIECEGMKALISEGEKIIESSGDPAAKDAALISAAQRVEHYEIAAYGTAKTLAGQFGLNEAESLLEQTLDEESQADKLLTKIATGGMMKAGVNEKAR